MEEQRTQNERKTQNYKEDVAHAGAGVNIFNNTIWALVSWIIFVKNHMRCVMAFILPNRGIEFQLGLSLEYIITASKQTICVSPLITTVVIEQNADQAEDRGKQPENKEYKRTIRKGQKSISNNK